MGQMLIQCQDVWKNYGSQRALQGLSLQLESGKIVGLLGPNGSGKTTLIKILNGLLTPDRGLVLIDRAVDKPPNFVNVTRYHDKNPAKIAEIFQRKRSWFPMPWPLSSF